MPAGDWRVAIVRIGVGSICTSTHAHLVHPTTGRAACGVEPRATRPAPLTATRCTACEATRR